MRHQYGVPKPPGVTLTSFTDLGIPAPDFLLAPTQEDAKVQASPTEHSIDAQTTKGAGVVLKVDSFGVPYMEFSGGPDAWVDAGNHPVGQGQIDKMTVMYCVEPEAGGSNREVVVSCWQENNNARKKFWFGTTNGDTRDPILRYPRGASEYSLISNPFVNDFQHELGVGRRVCSSSVFTVESTTSIKSEFLSHGVSVSEYVSASTTSLGNATWEDHKVLVGAHRSGDALTGENFTGKIYWVALWKEALPVAYRSLATSVDRLHRQTVKGSSFVFGGAKAREWWVNSSVNQLYGYAPRTAGQQVSQFDIRYDQDTRLLLECVRPGICYDGPLSDLDLGSGRQEWAFDGSVVWRRITGTRREYGFKQLEDSAPYVKGGDTLWLPQGGNLDGFEAKADTFLTQHRVPYGPRIRYQWYNDEGERVKRFTGLLGRFNPWYQRLYLSGVQASGILDLSVSKPDRVRFEDSNVLMEHGTIKERQLVLMNALVDAWDYNVSINRYKSLTSDEKGLSLNTASEAYLYGPAYGVGDMTFRESRLQSVNYAIGSARISYSLIGCKVTSNPKFGLAITPNAVKVRSVGSGSQQNMTPETSDNNQYGFMQIDVESLTDLGGHSTCGWFSATPSEVVYRENGRSASNQQMSLLVAGQSTSHGWQNTLMLAFSPLKLAVWNGTSGDRTVVIHCVEIGASSQPALITEEEIGLRYQHLNSDGSRLVSEHAQQGNDTVTSDINVTEESGESWLGGNPTNERRFKIEISLTGVGVGWVLVDLVLNTGSSLYVCPDLDLEVA